MLYFFGAGPFFDIFVDSWVNVCFLHTFLNVFAAQGSLASHALSMILVPTAPTHVLNTAIPLGVAGAHPAFTATAPTACVDLGLSVAWME